MKLELSLSVLGLLLCVASTTAQDASTTAQDEFKVEISGMEVTITCPSYKTDTEWKSEPKAPSDETYGSDYKIKHYESHIHNGFYHCTSDGDTYKLYLKAKVCENCVEMDILTVAGVIIADLLITLGVLVLVYYFSKNRKGRVGVSGGGRPRGQKMARPPPVPNPDYEPIRKGQREVYAGLESRGF